MTERDQYDAIDDFARSIEEAYRVIRERMAKGGPGWEPKDPAQPNREKSGR